MPKKRRPTLVVLLHVPTGYVVRWIAPKLQWNDILIFIKESDGYRKYLPSRKAWHISEDLYQDLLREYAFLVVEEPIWDNINYGFDEPFKRTSPQARPSIPEEVQDAYNTLLILPSAPIELVKAAQRILAKQYHPDVGGSHEAMKRINLAADTVANWIASAQGKGA